MGLDKRSHMLDKSIRDGCYDAGHGTINLGMAVVIHQRGRTWEDSACDDHRYCKQAAGRMLLHETAIA